MSEAVHASVNDALTAVVLAGGASRRMGTDKSALVLDGQTMLRRVVDAMAMMHPVEIVVVGASRHAAGTLSAVGPEGGVRLVDDRWPGEGPLGGVVTGLLSARTDVVLVAPCDVPDLARGTVLADLVARLLADTSIDAAVPVIDGRRQHAIAAYRRGCAPQIEAAFAGGARRLDHGLAALGRVNEVAIEDGAAVSDLDTPADVEAWRTAHHVERPVGGGSVG